MDRLIERLDVFISQPINPPSPSTFLDINENFELWKFLEGPLLEGITRMLCLIFLLFTFSGLYPEATGELLYNETLTGFVAKYNRFTWSSFLVVLSLKNAIVLSRLRQNIRPN